MAKIPIETGDMRMPDGSVIRLLLNKDWEQLQVALDGIEAQTISVEAQDLKRDAWLVPRPNENGKWVQRPDDCWTGAKCAFCKGRVYWWANQTQLWLHCDCTQFVAPLTVSHVEDMKNMSSSLWEAFAGMALKGIQQWLATS